MPRGEGGWFGSWRLIYLGMPGADLSLRKPENAQIMLGSTPEEALTRNTARFDVNA
jgi:hypothetical protein